MFSTAAWISSMPEIAADERVVVLGLAAVHAQHPHVLRQLRILRRAHAGIAKGAEILGREERQAADVAHGCAARRPAASSAPMACAASSMILRPNSRAICSSACMSAHWP